MRFASLMPSFVLFFCFMASAHGEVRVDCDSLMSSFKRNLISNTLYSEVVLKTPVINELNRLLTSGKLTESEKDWVFSNIFFDQDFISVSPDRETENLIKMWEEKTQDITKSPLKNFKNAYQHFILNPEYLKQELSVQVLIDFHKEMMRGGLEGLDASQAGVIRNRVVGFYVPEEKLRSVLEQMKKFSPQLLAGVTNTYNSSVFIKYADANHVIPYLEKAISEHHAAIAEAKTLNDRIRAHTDFVKTYITIHPFMNGNGRTSRFILDFLLAKEGISAPILADTVDLFVSQKRFYEKVLEGIKTTRLLVADLEWRKLEGLDLMKSPFNISSNLPAKVWFTSEMLKGKKQPFPVDLYDYVQFIRDFASEVKGRSEIECLKVYVAWLKKWGVHFVEKDGTLDFYQIKRVPDEIMNIWRNSNKNSLQSNEGLNIFYKNFYETEQLHRGLSLNKSFTDAELIDYFRNPKPIYYSMNAGRHDGDLDTIVNDFKLFNQLMNHPDQLFQYATDHMNAEGHYRESPFNSTAKVFNVANRFARGFMMNPEWIKNMKGELVVSMLRPKYGVMDFNRLREISTKTGESVFKSKYPRQQEVSVAGSIHPASLMRLEFRDVEVQEVDQNSGESIAGKTKILLKRVITRLDTDPTKVRVQKFDAKDRLISDEIISLY